MLAIRITYQTYFLWKQHCNRWQEQTDDRLLGFIGDDNSPENPSAVLCKL
jgi:hypothetical protein